MDGVLPDELAEAVVRTTHPHDHTIKTCDMSISVFWNVETRMNCLLSIKISPLKASNLIQQLFGVRLESVDGLRYISFPGEIEIIPCPNVTLAACDVQIAERIFGPEVTRALSTTTMYVQEREQRRKKTKSVTAHISSNSDESVDINLNLGLYYGTRICTKLFPSQL
ncbi:uncharacterized protein F4807DRAFT_434044 [Annulohypoxylon truncatum]|uniref:uncharacterized protein n=1 Tax=Annulohypoxylon truncatum TaxID=327061 RepID=UPI002008190D|nr:uncharacterized protein F4807DRAFT_434044 [Annulohypoxylon truncatum]KAI1207652.1 hypothetical protein F4807DRAFT_434044 [Annulohypoxylon truncatum]